MNIYKINNKEVTQQQFEEYIQKVDALKYVETDTVNAFPFSNFFDGEYKSNRQINDHLQDLVGTNSTRHKSRNGETHKEEGKSLLENHKEETENELRNMISKQKKDCRDIFLYGKLLNHAEKKLTDKTEEKQGLKNNKHKANLDIVINRQFPKALQLIALATEYGHQKYMENDSDFLNYKSVSGGSQSYFNAAARHNTEREQIDNESGLPHVIHVAWNYLAALELWAEENNINIKEFSEKYLQKLR